MDTKDSRLLSKFANLMVVYSTSHQMIQKVNCQVAIIMRLL